MTRTLQTVVFVAVIVLTGSGPCPAERKQETTADTPQRIILLLPEGFHGWACADFGVAGAPLMRREGDALVARPRQGEVLKTGDKPDLFLFISEAKLEVNGVRHPLPEGFDRRGTYLGDTKNPVQRYCAFFGTVDEGDAAGEPPGFERSPGRSQRVSPEERRALVALFQATGGSNWKHHVGWLGPPGTECKWHGIVCGNKLGQAGVSYLDLSENNLIGTVPESVVQLRHLETLMLNGNHLSGMLPRALIRRWLTGELDISGEASLFTDISEIDLESEATSVLCARHRIILRSDYTAALYTERCRNATPGDRSTFCEVKEGRTFEFEMLAWLLESDGFFSMQDDYERGVTHATLERTRVTKGGKVFAVSNYANAGPARLWALQRAIEGVAASADWGKTSTLPECPRW